MRTRADVEDEIERAWSRLVGYPAFGTPPEVCREVADQMEAAIAGLPVDRTIGMRGVIRGLRMRAAEGDLP